MLVLELSQRDGASFQIRQATAAAQELVSELAVPLAGAVLNQLPFPLGAPELTEQLHQVLRHGTPTHFQLQASPPSSSSGTYACQILRIDQRIDAQTEERVLVLSLEQPARKTEALPALAHALETMPLGLIALRVVRSADQEITDFQATLCNQLAATLIGQSREAILSQPIKQQHPQTLIHTFYPHYEVVMQSGRPHQQLFHLLPQDQWLDVSVVSYEDGLLVSFQDVTAGQKTASLLENVMNSSPAAVRYYESIRDATGQIVDFLTSTGNELVAYRAFRPYASTTGRRLLELYPYLQTNGLFDRYVAVVESGKSDRFETVYQQGSSTSWFDCTAVPHEKGFVLTTLDITSFKRAQLDQQRQAELITGVLNSSASSILVLKPLYDETGAPIDFRVELANPATQVLFARFVGREFTQEEMLSQTLLTLFPAGKERDLFTALVAVVRTGQPIYHSVDYPQLGVAYDYAITAFQTGVLMITTDITPLRAYQQKLEANNAALTRSNDYLQQFAYVASHDLQEPLRKIYSFGDLLLNQHAAALDATGRDLLQRMQNAALRMQTLVKDLLDYSRLTTQQVPFQPVPLHTLLQGVLGDLETTIRDSRATVTVTGDALPTIRGDETQLRQLLQNLLTNALKFTKPGQPPQVRFTTDLLTADQLPQTGLSPVSRQWVSLRVADGGIGFDEVHLERIFELFHRLHGRSQYAGTGIGLAVVKKVVENHQGLITAHSQPGEGATFTVYLPLA